MTHTVSPAPRLRDQIVTLADDSLPPLEDVMHRALRRLDAALRAQEARQRSIPRRLWRGVRDHARERGTEWFASLFLVQFGLILYLPPDTFRLSASFDYMAALAPDWKWGAACIAVGLAHVAALVVNGTFRPWRFSPHIRAAASFLSVGLWWSVGWSFWQTALPGSPAPGTHRALFLLALWNFSLAIRDTGRIDGRHARHGR